MREEISSGSILRLDFTGHWQGRGRLGGRGLNGQCDMLSDLTRQNEAKQETQHYTQNCEIDGVSET